MATLGQNIKELREENKVSQEELARRQGIPLNELREIESNDLRPDRNTYEGLISNCSKSIAA